ncbi:beta-ketoacyl-ACP synthase III [Aliikangiella marina]|uniref:Beta-ketoacyl-ACP synthase III n=1 Tax=Aliikangiella marina TaxID=1712262 RepID=A0A545TH31_9GAMM|nr:beta-ketoacyl-ACP synthase III [Aliikangiella marina]TQV76537.1 beta-ketoacyl-ACP synthase III [Aliikangiella marina]
MYCPVISATGLFTPEQSISNQELVDSYNQYVEQTNHDNADKIAAGDIEPLQPSSVEFIEKASGIKSRFVLQKDSILNTSTMAPIMPVREDYELSYMAEMAVKAAKEALLTAKLEAQEIDLVIVAASNMERAYPAIAVEIQSALGCGGYAFDMNVACSSATFGIKTAADAIKCGTASKVLMVNPEICSGHLNFRDRDCHFIFGDVCTAVIIEREEDAVAREIQTVFKIEDFKLVTEYSNNIRNNFGFLNREADDPQKLLFKQQGRKVFKEVVPIVADLIQNLLDENNVDAQKVASFWLHQANINMNQLITKKVLGELPDNLIAPIVLDEYANTSSAGSVIAMHKYHSHLASDDYGVLCSFGAGYSAGAILLKKN